MITTFAFLYGVRIGDMMHEFSKIKPGITDETD